MIDRLNKRFLSVNKIAGVEAVLLPEGKYLFHLVVLAREKNIIAAELKEEGLQDIEALKKKVPANIPVVLQINGRGVINRRVSDASEQGDSQILSAVLPNAKLEDFYVQKFVSGKDLFASVIRKNTFEEIHTLFTSNGLNVINASTGPFAVQTIIPFLPKETQKIYSSGSLVEIKNGRMADFAPVAEVPSGEVTVGEEKISAVLAAAYAVALSEFLQGNPEGNVQSETLLQYKEEYNYQQLFKIYGYFILALFVCLLLINYFVYSYYKSENKTLAAQSSKYQQTIEDVKVLEKKVEEKEYFMKKSGWFATPRTSFYADEIATTIPASIKLTALKVNPLNDKVSKKEKREVFRSDTIIVSGLCSQPTVLNPWMDALKEKEWIQSLSNMNYEYDPKVHQGSFKIEIRLKDGF